MANDINRVILIGNLTKDVDLKYLQSGTAIANFSIANNKSYKVNNEKKEEVSFFNCVAFSKLAEMLNEYCKKGNKIALEGRLKQETWTDQDGGKKSAVKIIVESVQFLSMNKDKSDDKPVDNSASEQVENAFADDSLPF